MNDASFLRYAQYYDLLYRDKDYAREAQFVDSLLRKMEVSGGSLLDIGCGTGAHARELAKLGWRVVGVDLSSAMIQIAQEKAPVGSKTEFFSAAAAEFKLNRLFPAIISLFHVASYQTGAEDLYLMFANVRRHLAPGGVFIFDFWHGPGVLADPPGVRVRRLEDERMRVTRIAEPVHRPEEHIVDINYEIFIEDTTGGLIEHITELHRMRYFFQPEIESMLRRAGLSIERAHAGLSADKLDGQAWYGLIVARPLKDES